MKNRVLIIAAVILVAAGLYFALGKVDNTLETALKKGMTEFGVTADSVEVSAFGKGAALANLAYETEYLGYTILVTAENAEIKGFNPKSLEAFASANPPVVADNLSMKNVNVRLVPTNAVLDNTVILEKYDVKVGELTITDWRQDLGALSKTYKEAPLSAEFFRAALNAYMESLVYKDYSATMTMKGVPELEGDFNTHVDEISLLKPYGSKDGLVENPSISMQFTNMTTQMWNMGTSTYARAEMHDLIIPSPESLAGLLANYQALLEMADDPYPDFDNPALIAVFDILKREFLDRAPWSKLSFQGYTTNMSMPDGQDISVSYDLFENTLDFSDAYHVALTTKGFDLSSIFESVNLSEPQTAIIKAYMGDTPKADTGFTLKLAKTEADTSALGLSYNVSKLGSGNADMAFKLVVEDGLDLLLDPSSLLEQTQFIDLGMHFEDTGMLACILTLSAQDNNTTVSELKAMALGQAASLSANAGPNASQVQSALETMLTKPGKLGIALKAKQPMLLVDTGMALIFGMQGLEFNVEATPGSKDLEDYVPSELSALK